MAFPATRGTMQGGLISPTIFNVVVENVMRTWLAMTLEDHRMAHDRMGEGVGQRLGVLYADDCMFGSKDAEWLQHFMKVLFGLF